MGQLVPDPTARFVAASRAIFEGLACTMIETDVSLPDERNRPVTDGMRTLRRRTDVQITIRGSTTLNDQRNEVVRSWH